MFYLSLLSREYCLSYLKKNDSCYILPMSWHKIMWVLWSWGFDSSFIDLTAQILKNEKLVVWISDTFPTTYRFLFLFILSSMPRNKIQLLASQGALTYWQNCWLCCFIFSVVSYSSCRLPPQIPTVQGKVELFSCPFFNSGESQIMRHI